jgi:integrase
MNPKTLQRIMGHSTLQMKMDLYCHVLDETIEKEMATVIEIGTKMGQ